MYTRKVGATGERRRADAGDAVRNCHARKAGAIIERALADACSSGYHYIFECTWDIICKIIVRRTYTTVIIMVITRRRTAFISEYISKV